MDASRVDDLSGEDRKRILDLAASLAAIHGDVRLAREARGIQAYMASPRALEEDGPVELEPNKRHLAVNLEFALGIGRHRRGVGTVNRDSCGLCMKYRVPYRMSDLLSFPPLAERGYRTAGPGKVLGGVSSGNRLLFEDALGRLVPHHPGIMVPLASLPPEHPAIAYLKGRKHPFDPAAMDAQFGAGFCLKEPDIPMDNNRRYKFRRFPGPYNLRLTPQGRIVFLGQVFGSTEIWQARVVDKAEGNLRYVLHPDTWEWTPFETFNPETDKWELLHKAPDSPDPAKYYSAPGCRRSESFIGFDAALAWNMRAGLRGDNSFCILVEGPMDAARLGPPAIALLGKQPSPGQVMRLMTFFARFYFILDNDKNVSVDDRIKHIERVRKVCRGRLRGFEILNPYPDEKDPGDWSPDQASGFVDWLKTRKT